MEVVLYLAAAAVLVALIFLALKVRGSTQEGESLGTSARWLMLNVSTQTARVSNVRVNLTFPFFFYLI